MDLKKAKRVEELRCGNIMHSWRSISEVICEEFDDENQKSAGDQMHGYDLCVKALTTLFGTWKSVSDEVKDKWGF